MGSYKDFKYPGVSTYEIIALVMFISFLVLVFLFFSYKLYSNRKQDQSHQLFMYKTKKLDLTSIQRKILNELIKIIGIKYSVQILQNPVVFETALTRFLSFLKNPATLERLRLSKDPLSAVAKESAIIYEKLFRKQDFDDPLVDLKYLERGIFLCLFVEDKEIFLGKITGKKDNNFILRLFRSPKTFTEVVNRPIKVFFWRRGDSEYYFNSRITYLENKLAYLEIPKEYRRGVEMEMPSIKLKLPCTIVYSADPDPEIKNYTKGLIVKLKETEAIIASTQDLDTEQTYYIKFEILDFSMNITSRIFSDRIFEQGENYFYTFGFIEITDIAKNVIKQYIQEQSS